MRVAPIEVAALLSSVGCYYASTRIKAQIQQALDQHIYKRAATKLIRGTSKTRKWKLISDSKKQVPFIMARQISKPCNEYVSVNWDGKEKLVPLKQVSCTRKLLINLSQLDSELTVEEVREEKALSKGTVVTALGLLSSDNGILSIEPSEAHPFFLTTKSKEQMIEEISDEVETTLTYKERLYREMSFAFAGFLFGVSLVLRVAD